VQSGQLSTRLCRIGWSGVWKFTVSLTGLRARLRQFGQVIPTRIDLTGSGQVTVGGATLADTGGGGGAGARRANGPASRSNRERGFWVSMVAQ
jgi:hypothetical protein